MSKLSQMEHEVEALASKIEAIATSYPAVKKCYKGTQIYFSELFYRPGIMFLGINPGQGYWKHCTWSWKCCWIFCRSGIWGVNRFYWVKTGRTGKSFQVSGGNPTIHSRTAARIPELSYRGKSLKQIDI